MRLRSLFRPSYLIISLLVLGAFWAGHYSANRTQPAVLNSAGLVLPEMPIITDFALTDAAGVEFSATSLDGKWTLLFFGYTHCPDICPTTLATLKTVTAALQDLPAFKTASQVVFVSVDHERDTPQRLREYVSYFDPSFRAVSAPPAALHLLTRQLAATFVKVSEGETGDYWFDHSTSILLIGPERQLVAEFRFPHEAGELSAKIRAIIELVSG